MKLSPEALETMGESANDGLIHPYVWGPALVGAAQQIKELEAALSTAEADCEALMEVVTKLEALNAEVLRTWTARHAPDHCADDDVTAATERCSSGTLWYIATSNKKAMDLMGALPAHLRSEAEGNGTP